MAEVTEEAFRDEVLAFLDANATPRSEEKFVWGEGSDRVALFDEKAREAEQRQLEEAKAWRNKRWDAGLGWISGPPELGGRGLPPSYDRLYSALESRYEVPNQSFFGIGLGMVAPTIKDHADPAVRAELLPKMWRGDIVGCQLF